jgi:hypothetical protein
LPYADGFMTAAFFSHGMELTVRKKGINMTVLHYTTKKLTLNEQMTKQISKYTHK